MTTPVAREPIRLLVFSASLRADSYNTRLARLATSMIEAHGGTVDAASMQDFDCSSFNQDVQALPPGAEEFCRRILANDAMVIASPEYNASVPGVLKNAIDWASRKKPQPFNQLQTLLFSASPSMVGGNRGLWALRVPLEHLGARVYPDMFSLAESHKALGADGNILNGDLRARFESTIVAFMDLVEADKHYPCVKRTWIEFLGEHPDATRDAREVGSSAG